MLTNLVNSLKIEIQLQCFWCDGRGGEGIGGLGVIICGRDGEVGLL